MDSTDISTETFEKARENAVTETPELQRETHLIPNMVRNLIDELLTEGVEELKDKEARETAEEKFREILSEIKEQKGMEYLTKQVNRGGLRILFLGQVARSNTIYGLNVNDIFPEGIPGDK